MNNLTPSTGHATTDPYDVSFGQLKGLPDVVQARPSTVQSVQFLTGTTVTYIVQTLRQAAEGDTVYLQLISREGGTRLVLPPAVTNVIARQRDAITTRTRSEAGKRVAAERKAAGHVQTFSEEARAMGLNTRSVNAAKRAAKRAAKKSK